ncbi:MAG: UDP-N-acetylmuramoyl-tripeptide--D-alanyl-D-alanine ligase [Spirochaetes bacterium]|nr:UDP-N-acetylmuramoyl-tripeptide--D-alanyl-D-alanine ligase [Spirochaetota bacterium]
MVERNAGEGSRTVRGFDGAWLAESTGGTLAGDGSSRAATCEVDSRKVTPGCMFVALRGERADGHDFIGSAVARGASIVLAERKGCAARGKALSVLAGKACFVLVDDSLESLQSAALAWRLLFPKLLRIGVTGSSGKTTTKECIASILSRFMSIIVNPGNLNSEIGLPQSMFLVDGSHEVGVFEMGINRSGEMGVLSRVWSPQRVVVTNIGTAHIGILGDRQGIALEKSKAFSGMGPEGAAYLWEDDDFGDWMACRVPGRVVRFGERSADGLESVRDEGLDGWTIRWRGREARFPLPGRHNLLDALAAIAVAADLGATADHVTEGLSSMKALFGRTEIVRGETTVMRDCYNANPDSVERAIGLCDAAEWRGRRVYVLGGMLELGAESDSAHRAIGTVAGNSKADALFFFGEEAAPAREAALSAGFRGSVRFDTDFDELYSALRDFIRPGDLVLLKGSRGKALERLGPLFGMEG